MQLSDLAALLRVLRAAGVVHYNTPELEVRLDLTHKGELIEVATDADPDHDVVDGVSDGDGVAEDEEDPALLLERIARRNLQNKGD